MSDQNETEQAGAGENAQAGGGVTEGLVTIAALTEELEARNAELARLRGIEKNLSKQATRGERMEAIVRTQLESYREQIPAQVREEIKELPIDQQWKIAAALIKSATEPLPSAPHPGGPPPASAPVVQVPEQPMQSAAPPRPAASTQSAYEAEKQALIASGQFSSAAGLALMRKYFG